MLTNERHFLALMLKNIMMHIRCVLHALSLYFLCYVAIQNDGKYKTAKFESYFVPAMIFYWHATNFKKSGNYDIIVAFKLV